MRRLFLVPVLASLAALTPAALVHAQGAPHATLAASATASQETTLSVSATGRVERAPDYLDVIIAVVQYDPSATKAQAGAEASMAKAIVAVRALNLKDLDLKTGTVALSPRYEPQNRYDEARTIVGYQATISLRVRTTDLDTASEIIDAGLTNGANQVEGVSFGIKEALEAREEAMRLAGKAAKRKAQTLAESLDLKLGRVVTASENSNQSWYPVNRMLNSVQAGPANSGADEAVIPGKIEITVEVNVTYAAEAVEK